MELIWNPTGFDAEFLRSLNLCFPGWGGQRKFDWCFRRRAAGSPADLMILREGAEVFAGSAVTYARIRTLTGDEYNVAHMTGSWTLPAARQRGCFAQIFQASVAQAQARNCVLLTGFLADANRSRSTFVKAGASLLPAGYFIARGAGPSPPSSASIEPATAKDAHRARQMPAKGTRYVYTDEEWMAQYVNRPAPTQILRVNGASIAVVEYTQEQHRVIALYALDDVTYMAALNTLRYDSANKGRVLFTYTVQPDMMESLKARQFDFVPGSVLGYPTQADEAKALEQPPQLSGYAWPYGPWNPQNGDRM